MYYWWNDIPALNFQSREESRKQALAAKREKRKEKRKKKKEEQKRKQEEDEENKPKENSELPEDEDEEENDEDGKKWLFQISGKILLLLYFEYFLLELILVRYLVLPSEIDNWLS